MDNLLLLYIAGILWLIVSGIFLIASKTNDDDVSFAISGFSFVFGLLHIIFVIVVKFF
jgi:hypothetical protein